jgi:hypothetical protein
MYPPLLKSVAGRRQTKDSKVVLRARVLPKRGKDNISALYVKAMVIIGIITRKVILMILQP